REMATCVRHWAKGKRRIALGAKAILEVLRQRSDGPNSRLARRIVVSNHAEAAASRPARVGRLRPRRSRIEREVDARHTHSGRERTGVIGPRVTRLHIDVVVRPGYQDIRM